MQALADFESTASTNSATRPTNYILSYTCYNIVSMTNKDGGPTSSPKTSEQQQRETIARIARHKAESIYRQDPNYQFFGTADDIKKYHSAWQDYYQRYYGDYYQKVAQKFIEKERLENAKSDMQDTLKENKLNAKKVKASSLVDSPKRKEEEEEEKASTARLFKKQIQDKTKMRIKRLKKSRHFIPLAVAAIILIVGILFQYNQVIVSNIVAYMSPGNSETNTITEIDPTVAVNIHKNPTLIIPKLNIEAPITFGAKNDVGSMMTAMGNGVAHFSIPGASAVPGQFGNFVISGHSAGNVYEQSNYKFIFSGLTRMAKDDLVYVDYKNERYTYKITGTNTVEPTDVASLVKIGDDANAPAITLLTCTPLGTSRYRLLVYGEQVNPDYNKASNDSITERPGATKKINDASTMPSNTGSPLEQFVDWLFGNNQ